MASVANNNASTTPPAAAVAPSFSATLNPSTTNNNAVINNGLVKEVFDNAKFDPTEYINEKFPTKESLDQELDDFILKLRAKISVSNQELLDTIRLLQQFTIFLLFFP